MEARHRLLDRGALRRGDAARKRGRLTPRQLRLGFIFIWALVIAGSVVFYISRADDIRSGLEASSSPASVPLAAFIYLLVGCIRGFTLIPVTYLIPFGLLFLSPWVQFSLTIVGILLSSASIYYFAERLRLAEYFETHHAKAVGRVRGLLRRQELAIVIGWSMFPFVPTDVICYVCGALRIDVRKLLAGVLVGEGITCAVYIFLGRQLLSFML